MAVREKRVVGLDALALATKLLHRVRADDPTAGCWEAADLHWWWRTPRASDLTEQLFWVDDHGPVGAVVLTDWTNNWTCDVVVVPHLRDNALAGVWQCALDLVDHLPHVEVLARDDDAPMLGLLAEAGFQPTGERSGSTWMPACERPMTSELPDGFRLVVRADAHDTPHPMQRRNGYEVETRLRETSLYDPELDLAVFAPNGDVAAYGLFWNDFVTGVGMVEPLHIEDEYQRLGLDRALLAAGCERLVQRGAQRLKVGFDSDAAQQLYASVGFRTTSTDQAYRRKE